jgi:GAF domain-containing protein
VRETPLDSDFCVSNLLDGEFLQIPDARVDPRLASHPLVTGEPHLRFYAGALLKTADGCPLGMLCVLDYEPRRLDAAQEQALRLLARQTMAALELRRAAKSAEAERARYGALFNAIDDGCRELGHRQRASRAGMQVLTKPFPIETLAARVRQLVEA